MSAKFVHLHVHSHYTLLGALPKIPELVKKAQEFGCTALALTDRDNLYGAIEFYKECKAAGIKPIIGLDASIEGDKRLLLYAKNFTGYQNLLALVTKSHMQSGEKALVTKQMLAEHSDGLITLDPHTDEVALSEIYYLRPEDRRAWETMRAIEHGVADESGDIDAEDESFYFPSDKDMEEHFTKEQMEKTLAIADDCELELTVGKFIFPEFPLPKGVSADEYLHKLCIDGLKSRGFEGRADVLERLNYELDIIKVKGYAAYFLVVEDLMRFAHEHGIYTTIRGSVAGSITTYVLNITTIDPLAYNIPFERFLNPERPSAPDIDMDFADNRRDEVIEYARKKYGGDKVAQIGTFGTMLARGVVRDVARALGYAYGIGDRIAKEIPFGSQGFPMTLERALVENPELGKMYKNEEDVKDIIDLGKKIEGCARHVGVHAAGVVISPRPLIEYAPLQLDPKGGKIITQYDMYSVGEDGVGLTKFDFLGIRNLSILASAVDLVETTRGKKIDIEKIPLDDKKTYEMLTLGFTEGTFQLNGAGMTRFLKELRPTTIFDINAMVALFRPGPMESIPQYIERKHNPALITYLDPRMKEYLNMSHGLLVYQDDVLLTAIKLAGYTWIEADKLRKAMGKKIPAEMEEQKEKFILGAKKHGLSAQKADHLWKLIEPFAAYGFGKAHAASYGRLAYQTAYMKANFPLEYMAAVLTAEAGDIDTVSIMVAESKRMGLPVLPPEVNESFGDFTVLLGPSSERSEKAAALAGNIDRDSIRFGLYSIKNFGRGIADAIISERKANGKFETLSDFLRRVKDQNLNKKALESLIECGALDSLGERGVMLANLERLLEYHREATKEQTQDSLFLGLGGAVSDITLIPATEATLSDRLMWEKELLGLYVSGHPLDKYKEQLSKRPMTLSEVKVKVPPGTTAVIGGMIETIRMVLTKGGDQMAFVKLADMSGSIEAVVFPKNYAEYKNLLKPESLVAMKGRLSNRNGELSLVAEALKML